MKRFGFWESTIALIILTPTVVSGGSAYAGTCPAVGNDTDCGVIITVTQTGAKVAPTGQGTYDGLDDTLYGVVNNSSVPITSLKISATIPVFSFEGDGIDAFGIPGNASDSTGYGGPNAYFSNISSDESSGTVNFITPIAANGGVGYFSLEESTLSFTACLDIINNSILKQASGENICATFTPQQNYTLQQAAQLCGFKDFDWVQQITGEL